MAYKYVETQAYPLMEAESTNRYNASNSKVANSVAIHIHTRNE